jgi:hypothetical protein
LWVTFGAGPTPTPIPQWVLPVIIALLPVALGAAAASRIGTPSTYGAARALDARPGSHDLASTAVEFSESESDGFRALAVEDGLNSLKAHIDLERGTPLPAFPWTRWATAVAFAALLAWLPPLRGSAADGKSTPDAGTKDATSRTEAPAASRPAPLRPTPTSKPSDAGKESRTMSAVKKAGGEGGAGAGASGAGGGSKGDEAAGAGKAGAMAKASKAASAAGAGGSGATGGAAANRRRKPNRSARRRPRRKRSPMPRKSPKTTAAPRAGPPARVVAPHLRRNVRGEGETPDRPGGDDDAPDEDVDDDKEKSEQRGGVSPCARIARRLRPANFRFRETAPERRTRRSDAAEEIARHRGPHPRSPAARRRPRTPESGHREDEHRPDRSPHRTRNSGSRGRGGRDPESRTAIPTETLGSLGGRRQAPSRRAPRASAKGQP